MGEPTTIIKQLARRLQVDKLFTSWEPGFFEEKAFGDLQEHCEVQLGPDQFIYEESELPFSLANLPEVFTPFRKKVEKYSKTRKSVEAVDLVPSIAITDYNDSIQQWWSSRDDVSTDLRSAFPFGGGEESGLQRLRAYLWDTDHIAAYKKTRNGLVGADYSSKFSPYLALGCLSPITILEEIEKYEHERVKNDSTYWLKFELLWREYFRWIALKHGRHLFRLGGIRNTPLRPHADHPLFQRWTRGETGVAFIDANMRELNATGFMSNRGRQNVASHFVHQLKLPWTWGAAYFESQLVDYDVSSNWCNWMYVAGVGNDPRSRVFNIERQAERYDSNGQYVRLWLNNTKS